jgi:ribonuclease HII
VSVRQIAGVDEAGRGPVMGPLVVAGIVIDEPHSEALAEWGVRDSKQLTPKQREKMDVKIRQLALQVELLEISADTIDTQRRSKHNMNELETQWMVEILQRLRWDVAYIDAVDVDADRFGRAIQSHFAPPRLVVSEHKADSTYPVVSAASIVAKVRRDQRIAELHRVYGDFGSGYPSDPKTVHFLKEWIAHHDTFPDVVRKTWETASDILSKKRQRPLSP